MSLLKIINLLRYYFKLFEGSFVKQIKQLALIVNGTKPGAAQLGKLLTEEAERHGAKVKLTQVYPLEEGFLRNQDACCVIGGDGTLLGIVPESVRWQVPVFGINRGKLGFLATYSAHEAQQGLCKILRGEYQVQERSVVECVSADGSCEIALNDVVFKSENVSHLLGLRVACDNHLVTDYYSDGLVFCTPTGSTAYNLAAGGPIVTPDAQVLTMTPICAHTLTHRSVVFSQETSLSVHVLQMSEKLLLALDGVQRFKGEHAFPYTIRISKKKLPLLQPYDLSYFKILRSKLRWGEKSTRLGFAEDGLSS